MSKKIGGVFALAGLCALSLFLLNCGSSSSRPAGALYVLTQGSNGVGNNVTSYAIDLGSGNLSLINSNASTCTSQGTSCGPPLDIVLDPTGAAAFVLNQGVPSIPAAPTIYAYTIGSDGSFGSPTVAATLTPGDTAIAMTRDADGKFLFVITLAPQVLVFSTSPGSTTLTPVDNSALSVTRIPTALSAITFTPQGGTAQEFLFVTSNNDPVLHNDNTLSVYVVASDGTLTEQTGSPYATTTDPLSVQAVNTNPAGQNVGGVFVYVGSQPTAAGALNIFEMCTVVDAVCSQSDVTNALLMPVTTPPPPSPGANPVAMLVDPTNTFLYVVCEGSSQVFGYKIGTTSGTLTALSPASEPTGLHPVAMAMHPSVKSSGAFLYTSNSGSSNISGFSVSTTTGSMSSPITVSSPSVPSGMAAR
ncbi:MAG: lactonase family protein [Acidobacteriia bacterium]|nr:lactonase family protein [Terriglobia bacterium]